MTKMTKIEACRGAYEFVHGYLPELSFQAFYRRTFWAAGAWHFHGHYDFTF